MNKKDYRVLWKNIIIGEEKSWVVFEHNTCVILMNPEEDLTQQSKTLLRKYGPYQVGTPSADMNVTELQNYPGWIVTGNHPDILNYIAPDEVEENSEKSLVIGLLGRHNRATDAKELNIIYIEDKRKN